MLIRKLFQLENAHIVRGSSTRRCSHSIRGHDQVDLDTDTGAAQCFPAEADNPRMDRSDLDAIEFAPAIIAGSRDPSLFERHRCRHRLAASLQGPWRHDTDPIRRNRMRDPFDQLEAESTAAGLAAANSTAPVELQTPFPELHMTEEPA